MKDYLEFFGLRDDPFKITPDANYFFLSESHQEALTSLKYIVESEEGFAVIVGEPGTGKTLTVRKFVDELPSNVEYAYILFPNLSPEELFEAILEDFGIKSEGETKNRLFSKMRDFLIKKRLSGKKVLIIVDEAQNLPEETLEELRILSNLETSDQKLLQIILLGQPELEEKLNSDRLRQLKQRITVFVKLRNLTNEETRSYVEYRLAKAGGGNVRIHGGVFKILYENSLGIPRLINILMERSLMAAYVDSSYEIKKKHIKRAVESLGFRVKERNLLPAFAYVVVALLIALSILFYLFLSKREPQTTSFTETPAPEKKLAVVDTPMLNMRAEPDPDSDVIYVLKEGDKLKVIEEGPAPWVKTLFVKGALKISGWVNGKYLTFEIEY